MLMTVMCQEPNCKRAANIIFKLGSKIEKCPTCGVYHNVQTEYNFCYEHAYLFLRAKHQDIMAKDGYYIPGQPMTLSTRRLEGMEK